MPVVKTAISLDEDLFRHESEFLLKELNETYGDKSDTEQTAFSEAMRCKNRQMIEGEW
ncbi:MAG: hypothetical protein K8S62_02875 [Candidatus Sabulitectum sp.]|nr:hypothetical protein [Candidatus Sabulitectum sp.]